MEDNSKISFGNYLKSIRKSKGLTLMELEKESKISNSYLSQIENGKFEPSNDILRKLSKGLSVSYNELMQAAGYIGIEEDIYERDLFNSIEEYKETTYPDTKDFLSKSEVYHNKKRLNNETKILASKILDVLTEDLEVNYPSTEKIEAEHDKLMKAVEVYNKSIERKNKKR